MKPAQAAEMSKAGISSAPSFCCTCTAHAGMGVSPLIVPTMIMSRSATLRPAASSARRPAAAAMSLVTSSSAAMWRRRMPVRSAIHASEVSTTFSRSALATTRSGV